MSLSNGGGIRQAAFRYRARARTRIERSPPRIPAEILPDLNPIEQLFAKLKGFVRKAEPRTLDAVSDTIAHALMTIPPNECANYLTGAGYASA
jgi:transposase